MPQEQKSSEIAALTESGSGEAASSSTKWTLIYILLLAVSVGLLVAGNFVKIELAAHLLNELGIAGVVAFILALTIERVSAEEFRRRAERERKTLRQEFDRQTEAIKQDVFHQIYGRMLPPELRDELDDVLRSEFIRSELYLEFELTIEKDLQTSEEYVKSKCKTRSKIENITGQKRVFPLDYSIDQSPSDALRAEVKYLEFQASGCETEFLLKEGDLKNLVRTDENQIYLDIGSDPSRQIVVLPDHPTEMRIEYQAIRPMRGRGIYYSFTSHTGYLELTVFVKNRDLEVFAETYSSHPLKETNRHNKDNGYYNWEVKKPLLRHQAVHVNWRRPAALPKPAAVPQGAAAGTPVTSSAAGGSGSPTVPAAQPKSDSGGG